MLATAERVTSLAADQPRDDGEDDQADDVVDHGRAEHDLPLGRFEPSEVRQHARRDADRGRGQRRSGRRAPGSDRSPERRAPRNPRANGSATPTTATVVAARPTLISAVRSVCSPIWNSSMTTPISAQRGDHRIGRIEKSEHRSTEDHTGEQLAEHGWLTDPLRELAEQLRRENDRATSAPSSAPIPSAPAPGRSDAPARARSPRRFAFEVRVPLEPRDVVGDEGVRLLPRQSSSRAATLRRNVASRSTRGTARSSAPRSPCRRARGP